MMAPKREDQSTEEYFHYTYMYGMKKFFGWFLGTMSALLLMILAGLYNDHIVTCKTKDDVSEIKGQLTILGDLKEKVIVLNDHDKYLMPRVEALWSKNNPQGKLFSWTQTNNAQFIP